MFNMDELHRNIMTAHVTEIMKYGPNGAMEASTMLLAGALFIWGKEGKIEEALDHVKVLVLDMIEQMGKGEKEEVS
jgi:hypothetical protein